MKTFRWNPGPIPRIWVAKNLILNAFKRIFCALTGPPGAGPPAESHCSSSDDADEPSSRGSSRPNSAHEDDQVWKRSQHNSVMKLGRSGLTFNRRGGGIEKMSGKKVQLLEF